MNFVRSKRGQKDVIDIEFQRSLPEDSRR